MERSGARRRGTRLAASRQDRLPGTPTPGIGPWLTLDHLDEWDVLIFYKLDRGFRNHLDFLLFYHEFCKVHGKGIVCVAQDIDMTTRMGERFASDLVQFAEWELEEMSQRRSAAAAVIRKAARWGGGSFSFGYEPYKDGSYWYLRPHPVYREETVWMAEEVVSGKSPGTVARMLNERKVPTARDIQNAFFGRPARGYEWTSTDGTRGHWEALDLSRCGSP